MAYFIYTSEKGKEKIIERLFIKKISLELLGWDFFDDGCFNDESTVENIINHIDSVIKSYSTREYRWANHKEFIEAVSIIEQKLIPFLKNQSKDLIVSVGDNNNF